MGAALLEELDIADELDITDELDIADELDITDELDIADELLFRLLELESPLSAPQAVSKAKQVINP